MRPKELVNELIADNEYLRKETEKLRNENEVLRKLCEELRNKYESLEKLLRKYENPHTPPSMKMVKEKETKQEKLPKKRGAPKGHRGATRVAPKPDEIVYLKPETCPNCGGHDIEVLNERKKTVEDIEIKKKVTRFHYNDCCCMICKRKFTTSSENLPKTGIFGPAISSVWAMLHYNGTVPFDRLSKFSNGLGIELTPTALQNTIYRTAGIFEPEFNDIWDRVANSDYVRSDETSYSKSSG